MKIVTQQRGGGRIKITRNGAETIAPRLENTTILQHLRVGDIDIGTTDMVLLTLLNESSNDIGNRNPLESRPSSKPRKESRRPTKSERAEVEQGRQGIVARVGACTRWVAAPEAHVSFLAEKLRLELFTPT